MKKRKKNLKKRKNKKDNINKYLINYILNDFYYLYIFKTNLIFLNI